MRQYVGTLKFGPENRVSDKGRPYSSIAVSVEGEPTLARVFGPPDFAGFAGLEPGVTVPLAKDSAGRWHLLEQPQGDQQGRPMGFAPPAVQQQQTHHHVSQAAVAAAPVPAGDPAVLMADQWFSVYSRLVSQGVPEQVAGGAASTCVIQLSRR